MIVIEEVDDDDDGDYYDAVDADDQFFTPKSSMTVNTHKLVESSEAVIFKKIFYITCHVGDSDI